MKPLNDFRVERGATWIEVYRGNTAQTTPHTIMTLEEATNLAVVLLRTAANHNEVAQIWLEKLEEVL